MKKILIALLLFSASLRAATNDGTHRFYGYAYDLQTGAYLYTEVHAQTIVKNRWTGGRIGYFAPDGSKIGEKVLDFSVDPYIPVYRLDLPGEGYYESITAVGERVEMRSRSSAGSAEKSGSLKKTPGLVADSGFHSYLVDNLPVLKDGKTLRFTLAVAGNRDSYKFKAVKTDETTFDGKRGMSLRVEADSLLSWVTDPLELIYDLDSPQLLEYRGISNIHDPATGKPYDVRIVYLTVPPADAPQTLPPLR